MGIDYCVNNQTVGVWFDWEGKRKCFRGLTLSDELEHLGSIILGNINFTKVFIDCHIIRR